MRLQLGVDGGGSKAVAVVATPEGDIVGAARQLGTADIYASGGEEASVGLVERVVDAALAQAGADRRGVSRAVLSLAGADWPEDFAYHATSWEGFGFGGPALIVNDAIGALAGAVPEGPAVVVSIGTGAATGARGPEGRLWHSSFWQAPHGAAELARRTLDATVQAELGIGEATAMRAALLQITGDDEIEAVLHRYTARDAEPLPVGPLVSALLAAARDGDVVASAVVDDHGRGLGQVAAAAARRVAIDTMPFALSFTGGLAQVGADTLVPSALRAVELSGQTPHLVPARWQPALGALVIGFQADGRWDRGVAERLDATLPPSSLYEVLSA
ncbi:MAG: BadF/BadG/BcrA/BcrD ATPase family protein [Candidatus Limnocylindria bacterium]